MFSLVKWLLSLSKHARPLLVRLENRLAFTFLFVEGSRTMVLLRYSL